MSRRGLQSVLKVLGYSRQGYYKALSLRERREELAQKVQENVKKIRQDQPRVGCRKLKDHLMAEGIIIGRDRLMDYMRSWSLLVKPKRNFKRTTNSRHRYKKYKNIIKSKKPKRPNQIWVSDITYLRVKESFVYLSLITDKYSRKIVGHHVHHSLSADGAIIALRQALREQQPEVNGLIHHSDCGVQYCSNDYVALLKKYRVAISMTEDCHLAENSMAERVNGILKNEFLLKVTWPSIGAVRRALAQAIYIYNTKRLHNSLKNKTPEYVHGLN